MYAYYDVVREYGLGFQYQCNNKYNVDFSVSKIYPYGCLYEKISQWDYYDFQGYGFKFNPKFMFGRINKMYVGLNLSYEQLSHDTVRVYNYNGRGTEYYYTLSKSKGVGFTVGVTVGNKIRFNFLFMEPFISLGLTETHTKNTDYATTSNRLNLWKQYPYSYSQSKAFFYTTIGLKLGLSFKKSKKHAAIDKKFDDVYIPKTTLLKTYFKSVNFKDRSLQKDTRRAYARYKGLNRNALFSYRRYYADTTLFYKKIDFLFQRIDSLIIKGQK
ncbi:MAG: hypothetical protein V4580_00625 [Bacteroidota bacterium]